MDIIFYVVIVAVVIYVFNYIWKKTLQSKSEQKLVDQSELAPYKVEPLNEVVSTPMIEVSPEVVAAAYTPELKVVSGSASVKKSTVKKPAAKKPSTTSTAKKKPAVKTSRTKKPTDNA